MTTTLTLLFCINMAFSCKLHELLHFFCFCCIQSFECEHHFNKLFGMKITDKRKWLKQLLWRKSQIINPLSEDQSCPEPAAATEIHAHVLYAWGRSPPGKRITKTNHKGALQLFCTIWCKDYTISFRFIVLASFGGKRIPNYSREKPELKTK